MRKIATVVLQVATGTFFRTLYHSMILLVILATKRQQRRTFTTSLHQRVFQDKQTIAREFTITRIYFGDVTTFSLCKLFDACQSRNSAVTLRRVLHIQGEGRADRPAVFHRSTTINSFRQHFCLPGVRTLILDDCKPSSTKVQRVVIRENTSCLLLQLSAHVFK